MAHVIIIFMAHQKVNFFNHFFPVAEDGNGVPLYAQQTSLLWTGHVGTLQNILKTNTLSIRPLSKLAYTYQTVI